MGCDYCNKQPKYVDSSVVYGKSYGMIYYCKPCDAYVGVHKGTDKPLGRLANRELRYWKKEAHKFFDPLWIRKLEKRKKEDSTYKKCYARGSGYKWLAKQLGITRENCHIGMFNVDKCKEVVAICSKYYK